MAPVHPTQPMPRVRPGRPSTPMDRAWPMRERITSLTRNNTDLVWLVALLLVLLIAYQHYDSSLFTPASVTILSAQFLPLILAAAGQTTVMLLGGIDLSLGAVLG